MIFNYGARGEVTDTIRSTRLSNLPPPTSYDGETLRILIVNFLPFLG